MMEKQDILEEAKAQLTALVEDLNFDHLKDKRKKIEDYLSFIDLLDELDWREPEKKQEKSAEPHKKTGVLFERKLKGGVLPSLDIYVPEKIVRELDLDQGDEVCATRQHGGPPKQHFYNFELIKKGKKQAKKDNRVEIKYCIVERDQGLWVCNRTVGGDLIRIDDVPFSVRLKDDERADFHLSEGDIVDIAYYRDNPLVCKVVWKHMMKGPEAAPLPAGAYKTKRKIRTTMKKRLPNLAGFTLTLVGGVDLQTKFREAIEETGLTFQALDGTENEERISGAIHKSDLVLILIPAVSHAGAKLAKKLAKDHNVPFDTLDTIGTQNFVSTALSFFTQDQRIHAT